MGAVFFTIVYFMIGMPISIVFVKATGPWSDDINTEERVMGCVLAILISTMWPFLLIWFVVRAPFIYLLEKAFPGND